MLIEFRVENHRSLRDEQGITFEATAVDAGDARVREVAGHRLLPVAAIYGANASGKSTILSGLQFMADAVTASLRFWAPTDGVPRTPFAWEDGPRTPSMFEAVFLIDGVHHTWGFVVDDHVVLEEWMYARPKGRKQVWFERDRQQFRFGEHLKGENTTLAQLTRNNSLFLSTAVQYNHQQLLPAWRFFAGMRFPMRRHRWTRVVTVHDGPRRWFSDEPLQAFPGTDVERLKRDFLALLRQADLGILGVRVRHNEIELQHRADPTEPWLPLQEESDGTRRLFEVLPLVLSALHQGGVVVIDELEQSLHPLLAVELLRLFNGLDTNPMHAQLVFSTHDTVLLGNMFEETPLRRDQVWLAEKDRAGHSVILPLSDYRVRKGENVERGYLQGRYGATPIVHSLLPTDRG